MSIEGTIISIVNEMKPYPGPVTESSNLYFDLGFNSLAFIALLVAIEEALSVSIGIEEMQDCLQIDRLITTVKRKRKEREPVDD